MYNPQTESFIRFADAGSFSKAAEEMYITPTAVIKQINLLESSLDLILFDRTHRGRSNYIDRLRDDIRQNHAEINIVDFDFYSMSIFRRCENTNDVLLAIPAWANVHPLLKVIPVEWEYSIPYGLLHSPTPSENVRRVLEAAKSITRENK